MIGIFRFILIKTIPSLAIRLELGSVFMGQSMGLHMTYDPWVDPGQVEATKLAIIALSLKMAIQHLTMLS